MDWEQLGYMAGNALAMNHAQNYFDRGVDKARNRLADLVNPTAAERNKAMAQAEARFGGGFVGQNPAVQLLAQKRDWAQADNDAQYLLDNGYAEDSPEVQEFRRKQAGAHENAELLRALGKSAGMDLTQVGAGMGLDDLKNAVNRALAPGLYQTPDALDMLTKDRAWAGKTARDILGDQVAQGAQRIHTTAGAPAAAAQPVTGAEPMTPPAAQLGGYSPQGRTLLNFDPNAGFGMAGTANPTPPDQNSSLGRAITGADVYKFLQEQGVIAKERTFAEEVEEIAKLYAQQRAAKMSDREIRQYLKEGGVPSNIAKIVMAERTQQMQEQAKKEALAQAAAASSSPQMAALIAAAAADPNTKLSDIAGLINATNPDMQLDKIDLGGSLVAMTHDRRGRVAGGAQTLPKSISPSDTVRMQVADTNGRYRLASADLNGQYQLASAAMRGGGRSAGSGEKKTAAEAKLDAKYGNQFTNVMELYAKSGDVSKEDFENAVERFTDTVQEGFNNGEISGDNWNNFHNMAYLSQLLYAARFGERDQAREIWESMDEDWKQNTDNPYYMVMNNIYPWIYGGDPGEDAHIKNTIPAQEKPPEIPARAYNYLPPNYGK